jgi:hypothetical protein
MDSVFRSHTFGYFEIIKQGWMLFRKGFANILVIGLLVYLPYNILLYLFNRENWVTSVQTGASSLALCSPIVSNGGCHLTERWHWTHD